MISSRNVGRVERLLGVAIVLAFSVNAAAAEYYVAPTGDDSNPGTLDQPFATLSKGQDAAKAGDTVWIRGGTYQIVTPANSGAGIALTKSGTSDTARINYWAYQAEVPVFDFSMLKISTTSYTHGFVVSGSYLYLKGLEIENVPMNTNSNCGLSANGSNNIFELLNLHNNNGTGLFINGGNGGNLILNCDSHDNYDPTSSQGDGQNADGFGVHYQKSGPSTTVRGCRAWWNSDDGYDLINQEVPVTIEGSWAMGNGYIDSGTKRPADGNGNGFKAGSSKTGVRHTVQNCLAWGNVASGFYANHSSGGNDWYNNTSYKNGTQYNMLASDPNDSSTTIILMGDKVHRMRNNVGYPNKNTNMTGVDTSFNTWDLNITPADSDFVSVKDTGFMGARQADGSMPVVDFMHLSAQSPLIDKGTDVGLAFAGAAPDLGCYETGLPSGSGGTNAGGAGSGAAGAPASAGAGDTSGGGAGGARTSAGGSATMGRGGRAPGAGGMLGGGTGANGGEPGAAAAGGGTGGNGASGGSSAGATGGAGTGGGSSGGTAGAPGSSPSGTAGTNGSTTDSGGCGCRAAGHAGQSYGGALAALGLAVLVRRRRAAAIKPLAR
jgi:MYXO-CTERM domain-containing protein